MIDMKDAVIISRREYNELQAKKDYCAKLVDAIGFCCETNFDESAGGIWKKQYTITIDRKKIIGFFSGIPIDASSITVRFKDDNII